MGLCGALGDAVGLAGIRGACPGFDVVPWLRGCAPTTPLGPSTSLARCHSLMGLSPHTNLWVFSMLGLLFLAHFHCLGGILQISYFG